MRKKIIASFLFFASVLLISPVLATPIDPGYTSNFGWGVIVASSKGYPVIDKFDASQFEYKNGAFYVDGGEEATLNLRQILPKGMKDGEYEAIIKEKLPDSMADFEKYTSNWRIWNLPEGKSWPKKKLTAPGWDPVAECIYYGDDYSVTADWVSSGCKWEDLSDSFSSTLRSAQSGDKFLVQYTEGYRANIKRTENKWDPVYNVWKPTPTSTWAFERLEPAIAEGWIVIK